MNYYNEHDPNAAAWLEELVAAGDLPPGLVDSRDVQDIGLTEPLDAYDQCHFFTGIGGWSHALDLSGWPRDRPIWNASLPCQPFSDAGKSLGVTDERHLWPVFRGLVEQYRPVCVVGEQVASKAGRAWFSTLRSEMEALGYECGAVDICAASISAPHIRQRLYWCAVRLGNPERIPPRRNPGASAEAEGEAQLRAERNNPGPSGDVGRVGDSQGKRPTGDRQGNPAEGRPTRKDQSTSDVGGLADNQRHGLDRSREAGERRRAESSDSSNGSPWSAVVYVPCADGKARPLPRIAESCLEPLADGFSGDMVRGGDSGAPQVALPPLVTQQTDNLNDTNEARTMRLKGYGNAIVAPLAAEFISAFMEILEEKKSSEPC